MCVGAAVAGLTLIGAVPGPDVLSAINGMTVYVYDDDAPASRTGPCRSSCNAVWPRVPARAMPMDEGIGAIVHEDGVAQATYDGRPVHFYAGDRKPGDVNGDDVGSIWHAIRPAAHANPGAAYAQVTDDF
jgi:predicted lipoprotein with Yx(FWY)xxD motif